MYRLVGRERINSEIPGNFFFPFPPPRVHAGGKKKQVRNQSPSKYIQQQNFGNEIIDCEKLGRRNEKPGRLNTGVWLITHHEQPYMKNCISTNLFPSFPHVTRVDDVIFFFYFFIGVLFCFNREDESLNFRGVYLNAKEKIKN